MKYIAYDLDGTLVKFNTFKVWVILSFLLSLVCFRISFLTRFIGLVKSRKKGNLDRLGFKISLLALQVNSAFWEKIGDIYGRWLAKYFLRKDLLALHENAVRCLATAAPDIYAIPFSLQTKAFDTVICSHFIGDNDYIETLNENKKSAVLETFSSHPDILFTDHYDDIPLIQSCKFSYLVSPDKSSKKKFISTLSVDTYKIID